jgi:hypothetical protein
VIYQNDAASQPILLTWTTAYAIVVQTAIATMATQRFSIASRDGTQTTLLSCGDVAPKHYAK